MKKMIFSIVIILVTAGLASPSAMARGMRGGASSNRSRVEMRGPGHGPRVSKPQPPIGGHVGPMHYGMRFTHRPVGVAVDFRDVNFIYDNGVFYSRIRGGYEVVRPQIGMIVPSLPMGHTVIIKNGRKHFVHNGIMYSPTRRNGITVFRVEGFI